MHIGDFKIMKVTHESSSKVAVVMPVFNESKYLEEAIQSIITQTYKNTILIIIDDGSTEQATQETLKKY